MERERDRSLVVGLYLLNSGRRPIPWMAMAMGLLVWLGGLVVASAASAPVGTTRVSLVAGGDVMFGRIVQGKLRRRGYDRPFRWIRPLLAGNDLVLCNLETPITSRRLAWRKGSRLVFRAEPKAATILRDAGFNLIVTANNHAQDQRGAGIVETIEHLRRAGLSWVGTGRTMQEAWRPYIFRKGNIKIGVLAVTRLVNYGARQRGGFLAHLTRQTVRKALPPRVRALARKVDFVVVVLHWGTEYIHDVIGRERLLIRKLAAAGANLFIGHHPHVLRGIQYVDGLVAFYSLGNLSFDFSRGATSESGLAHVMFEKAADGTKHMSAEFIPLRIGRDGLPRRPGEEDQKLLMKKMVRYSRQFRRTTRFLYRADRLLVEPVRGGSRP